MQATHKKDRRVLAIAAALLVILAVAFVSSRFCVSAYLFRGVLIDQCPDGDMRQTIFFDGWSLHRGTEGSVRVGAIANYTTKDADALLTTTVRRLNVDLSLVKPKGEEVPLVP